MALCSSRLTTPKAVRSRGPCLATALIAAWLLSVPAASAADGDPAWVLDRPLADAALIERGVGLSPDLLTLDTSGAASGALRVTLLRRDVDWSILGETTVDVASADFFMPPWLVDLGAGRFAVVLAVGQPLTSVVPLRVDPTSPIAPIVAGTTVDLDLLVTDAGAADVIGDHARELVVAGNHDGDSSSCAGATIEVLSGDDLGERLVHELPKLRVAGGALGEFDGRAGADLLVHAYETCPIEPDAGEPHHLLGIRLRDGSTIVDIPAAQLDPANYWHSLPLVVDVDGDGRDEAIVRGDSTIAMVDPTDDWEFTTIAEGSLAPLVVTPSALGEPTTQLTWLASTGPPRGHEVRMTRIGRVDGALTVGPATGQAVTGVPPDEYDGLLARLLDAEQSQVPPVPWSGDFDGDGCPEIVAPRLLAGCLGTGAIEPGGRWLGARPVAIVGGAGERRLLTATGLEWYPYPGAPPIPAPAAVAAPGAWRHASWVSFTLAEVPLPTGADDATVPVAPPAIEAFASPDGSIDLSGPAGSRLLVRVTPLVPGAAVAQADDVWTRAGFLRTEPRTFEFTSLIPIPVAPGAGPAATTGSVPFDIRGNVPAPARPDEEERWMVLAATLDPSGNVSDPVVATVTYDVTAPTVEVGVPFVSAPWPFDAGLSGTTEAGTTVRVGDGPSVPVGETGSFEVRTQLAPWPQTLEVNVVDPSGNVGSTQVSVMGGLDVRQLPWPAIGAATVLVAVLLSSLRGTRRTSTVTVAPGRPDDDHLPEIEELGQSRLQRRD